MIILMFFAYYSTYKYILERNVSKVLLLTFIVLISFPLYFTTNANQFHPLHSKKLYRSDSQLVEQICVSHNLFTFLMIDDLRFLKSTYNDRKQYLSAASFLSHFNYSKKDIIQKDSDPLREWVSKFISEDTTYNKYSANLSVDTITSSFLGSRILRWEFALQIFIYEYDWKQKIFGGGFNFLNWYGYYFNNDKTRSDYPHNPFLQILLYSGIFGLFIYLIFLFKAFLYYIKYLKESWIFFVFFLITFFFSFFSGGSPFDPPIMGFFYILPFFIHFIHTKSKQD